MDKSFSHSFQLPEDIAALNDEEFLQSIPMTEKPRDTTKMHSRPPSDVSLQAGSGRHAPSFFSVTGGSTQGKYRFKSYRLQGNYEQPWRSDPRMKRSRINNWIVWGLTVLGFALSALICVMKARTITTRNYCLVYEDNFKSLDSNIWSHEVQLDGFGTGSFDWTTTDSKNSYVDSEGLHIVPTLTNMTTDIGDGKLYDGHTLNLTADGTCTSTSERSCVASSNMTLGGMIPPVRSARLSTKGKKSIRYGRVEVVAKIPKGDWLWPAIWMMPEESVYGEWPRSGEIDIMEARGNGPEYPAGGRDVFTSTLHWGMSFASDAFWRTTAGRPIRRTDYSEDYHTYGIEWTEDHIYTYLDSRLVQVLFTGFKSSSSLWELGKFAATSENSTLLRNPWEKSKSPKNAPFDQKFFLILNVAVGSKNGWFPDKKGGKPWLDAGASAQWDFYKDVHSWLPTWGEGASRGMTIKTVRMWQQGSC